MCPLCRHDMRSLPEAIESPGESRISGEAPASPDRLAELEELWAGKSDESLEEAARTILDYTVAGQRVIREELQRRSIQVAAPESQEEKSSELAGEGGVPIYSSPDFLHVDTLEGFLKSRGIACEIRSSRSGPLSNRPWPELWVLDETQAVPARHALQQELHEAQSSMSSAATQAVDEPQAGIDIAQKTDGEPTETSPVWTWTCPRCSEEVENQFWECWNCGFERSSESAV